MTSLTSAGVAAVAVTAIALSGAGSPTLVAQRPEAARLTIDRITGSPSLAGTPPSNVEWSPDSRVLAFLWNDQGRPERDVWTVPATGGAPRRLTHYATDGGAARPRGVTEIAWSPDSSSMAFLLDGDVHRMRADGTRPEALTSDGSRRSDLAVSPDGRYLSWLQDGDLWLRHDTDGAVVRATRVGVPGTGTVPLGTYNRPDVEFGRYVWGGGVPGYRWAPDSRTIALHYVDRRQVRKVPFPYYLGEETSANVLRRGYPGDHDEIRTLAFYAVASGRLQMVDFPDQGWRHINGYEWSPGGRLLIDQVTDTQQERWLWLADPADASLARAWYDRRDTRGYTAVEATWAADGARILMVGDLDDRYRLYALTPGATPPTPLTPPDFDVSGVTVNGDGTARSVFFVSNQKNPYERHVYRMSEQGGAITQVTTLPGTHAPFVSPDGARVAVLTSNDVTPPDLYLVDARGGAEERITRSPGEEFRRLRWVQPRYVTFKSRIDDFTLHARILEPPDLDRTRTYPVIVGPVYSNTVRNQWRGGNGMLQQLLAVERGYIVVQVDVRGSTGYGRDFRERFVMDYGGADLDDVHSALEYLKTVPYADTGRAGIWGSSYGGLFTTYMLFKKPGLFKAGVAAASAVDPRFFGVDDAAITRLPNTHPEAFRRGSASAYAHNLQDHLLFIHGMQDDVVPFKTVVDLAEQLMLLGKDFDIAIAPAATHGWTQRPHYAAFMYKKLVSHFDRHLGGGPAAAPSSAGR